MSIASMMYDFMSGFGLPAYTSVPDDAAYPYLTYDLSVGDDVTIGVNLWYRTDSEVEPNAKAEEIRQYVGHGGIRISGDEGMIWIKRGTPFVQSMGDPSDTLVKRKYIQLDVSYIGW